MLTPLGKLSLVRSAEMLYILWEQATSGKKLTIEKLITTSLSNVGISPK